MHAMSFALARLNRYMNMYIRDNKFKNYTTIWKWGNGIASGGVRDYQISFQRK